MKRVRCPKCDSYIAFDETKYHSGQRLVFQCTECSRQFGIKIGSAPVRELRKNEHIQLRQEEEEAAQKYGSLVVVENVFHYKQVLPLQPGENKIGRYVRGTKVNLPIETVDPSIDTTHCIINVKRTGNGKLQYILRDGPSGTGTFYMNNILGNNETVILNDGDIITIGATTLIVHTADDCL